MSPNLHVDYNMPTLHTVDAAISISNREKQMIKIN